MAQTEGHCAGDEALRSCAIMGGCCPIRVPSDRLNVVACGV
jgi:hypothetical protein